MSLSDIEFRRRIIEGTFTPEQTQIIKDILIKLNETNQTYIAGFDFPISVSQGIFAMLQRQLEALARKRRVPIEQLEFEDLFAFWMGITG